MFRKPFLPVFFCLVMPLLAGNSEASVPSSPSGPSHLKCFYIDGAGRKEQVASSLTAGAHCWYKPCIRFEPKKGEKKYDPLWKEERERASISDIAYDSVVAYEYEGNGGQRIVKGNELIDSIEKSQALKEEEVSEFDSLLTDTGTYGALTGACFDPHLGLVYYLEGAIEAHVSICLDCNNLRSSVDIPAMEHPSHLVPVEDGEDYHAKGFSMRARKALSRLCRSLGFGHCELHGPEGRYERKR